MLIGMNPAFCETGSLIPFCGSAELQRSRCTSCEHYTTCYAWQTGKSRRKLVDDCQGFKALAPGTPNHIVEAVQTINGFPLGGIISAGQILDNVLVALGVNRSKLFLTNIALCKSTAGNPKPQHVLSCSRIRLRTQRLLKPKVIVPLGLMAIGEYSPRKLTLGKEHGQVFNYEDAGIKYQVVPTYHPSAILRKMSEYSNAPVDERTKFMNDITKEKWALYQDLGVAINLLDKADIAKLVLPTAKLDQDGKLILKSR
jgi:uracil-DNA glycosylase family 4